MNSVFQFIKKNILGIMIGIVIAGTISVCAFTLSASDVFYDNSTSGLEADNVKDALNDLYTKVPVGTDRIKLTARVAYSTGPKLHTLYFNKNDFSFSKIKFTNNSNVSIMRIVYDGKEVYEGNSINLATNKEYDVSDWTGNGSLTIQLSCSSSVDYGSVAIDLYN